MKGICVEEQSINLMKFKVAAKSPNSYKNCNILPEYKELKKKTINGFLTCRLCYYRNNISSYISVLRTTGYQTQTDQHLVSAQVTSITLFNLCNQDPGQKE